MSFAHKVVLWMRQRWDCTLFATEQKAKFFSHSIVLRYS